MRGSFFEIVYFRAFKEAAVTTQIKGKFIEIKPRLKVNIEFANALNKSNEHFLMLASVSKKPLVNYINEKEAH